MKGLVFTLLACLVAGKICNRDTLNCDVPGIHGRVSGNAVQYTYYMDIHTVEACRQACYSPENAQCRSFAIRTRTAGNYCYLYNYTITNVVPDDTSTYTYYPLPVGIVGWVPENVAQHYRADTSKTKGNYAGCRQLCLEDPICKGIGYKEGGNCQLYDVSLKGKVHPDPNSPYIQWQEDCARV